jgi:hypothetical protein
MGMVSPSVSITRYRVKGKVEAPVLDTISAGLQKHRILEIDNDTAEKSVGWTSFETPYVPNFDGSSFVFGQYLVFSLRLDKKRISSKTLKKHTSLAEQKHLAESGREYLTGNERKLLKESVLRRLSLKTPATPHIYDVIWNYENGTLWYFSNLKTANEELEMLFSQTFKLGLIRMFPYTSADLTAALTDAQKDTLSRSTPTSFGG